MLLLCDSSHTGHTQLNDKMTEESVPISQIHRDMQGRANTASFLQPQQVKALAVILIIILHNWAC